MLLIYCIVSIAIPEKVKLLPLYVFLFACFVEFMQYLKIVEFLRLQNITFLRIIIGSVFDWADIVSYCLGCIFLVFFEMKKKKFDW